MAFTFDPSTDAGKVRLLCQDASAADAIFEDDSIQAFLDMAAGNVRRAAAMALESMAANQAIVQKKIELLDFKTDGASVARELRALATQLRDSAKEDEATFDWAEMVDNTATQYERLVKQSFRGGF